MSEKLSAFDVIVAQLTAQGIDPQAAAIMARNALQGKATEVNQAKMPDGRLVISVEERDFRLDLDERS